MSIHGSRKPLYYFSILTTLVLVVGFANAATYHVSTTGGDVSCPSAQNPATPGQSIGAGLACLGPGDTLRIRGGTYPQGVHWDRANGRSWSSPMVVEAAPGETVISQGAARDMWNLTGVHFAIIRGLIFDGGRGTNQLYDNAYTEMPVTGAERLVSLGCSSGDCSSDLVFEKNVFRNSAYSAVSINCADCSRVTFRQNEVYHIGKVENSPTFYIGSADVLFEGNRIHDIMGVAINAYNAAGSSVHNLIVRGNRIERTGYLWAPTSENGGLKCCVPKDRCTSFGSCGSGACLPGGWNGISCGQRFPQGAYTGYGAVYMSSGTNQRAYNNLIIDSGGGVSADSRNCEIAHNTVVGSTANKTYNGPEGASAGIGVAGEGCQVRNNLVWQPGITNPPPISLGASGVSLSNNLCSSAASGCTTTGDPKFMSAGDFHLQAGSPARDTGINLRTVTDDFDGAARLANQTYDIGAYEFGGAAGPVAGGPSRLPSPTNFRIAP